MHAQNVDDVIQDVDQADALTDAALRVAARSVGETKAQALDPAIIDAIAEFIKLLLEECGQDRIQARVRRAQRWRFFRNRVERALYRNTPDEVLDELPSFPRDLVDEAAEASDEDYAALQ